MLIVDNADDMDVLEGSDAEKGILDYLPESESGLTVFTTRDKQTADALASNSIVDVEKLDLVTASNLFKKMLTRKISCTTRRSSMSSSRSLTAFPWRSLRPLPTSIATQYLSKDTSAF
jgi:hypothetical protein